MCTARLYYDQPSKDDPITTSDTADKAVAPNGEARTPDGTEELQKKDVGSAGSSKNEQFQIQTDSKGVTENLTISPTLEGACGSTTGSIVGVFPPEEGAVVSGTSACSGGSQRNCVVCVVHGGMDTEGEIFDDCLILRLDDLL